jgi:hypothetical protein
MEKVQETKLFSAQAKQQDWVNALNGSSVSSNDAAFRKQEYEKIFSRYERMKEAYKMFSGVSEIPILSNQYFNATVASFVRSFAGYLSIERDMDQPTALLWFDDVLGVYDERMVLPNLGKENLEPASVSTLLAGPSGDEGKEDEEKSSETEPKVDPNFGEQGRQFSLNNGERYENPLLTTRW